MIAKIVTRRRNARARKDPFRARVDYICRKASLVNMGNLAGGWQDAAWQMTVTAGLTPRIRQPAYHIILSWPDTESPTDQEMLTAARMILTELDAEAHQYVLAVHRDRRNGHVHILINRVHPITGAGLSTSHDFARLELACRRIEREIGWATDRGRFDAVEADGQVRLVRKPASHWQQKHLQRAAGLRPDGQAQRDHERRTGWPSLRDMLPEWSRTAIATMIDGAKSWAEVHQILRRAHLTYRPHGSGARICRAVGEAWMPANQLGTDYGMPLLQSRLGVYRPSDASRTEESAASLPIPLGASNFGLADLTPLRSLFQQRKTLADWRREKRSARMALRQAHLHESHDLANVLGSLPRTIAAAFRRALRRGQQQDRRDLSAQHPPPLPLPFLPLDEIARVAPEEMQRRRYRQVHRHRAAGSEIEGTDLPGRDHTACRQRWCVPAPEEIPSELRKLDKHLRFWSDQIRIGADGIVILAMRQRQNSICGFLEMDLHAMTTDALAEGGRPGIAMLGNITARKTTIVPDIITALSIIGSGEAADGRRILIVPDPSGARVQAYLSALLDGDRPQTAISDRGDPAGWQNAIRKLTDNTRLLEPKERHGDLTSGPDL